MKKLLAVSAIAALGFTSVALAGGLPEEMPAAPAAVASSDTGVYLGIEGGYGQTNWKNVDAAVSSDNGFVGRAFLGYDINKYFAAELGYTYFFNKAGLPSYWTTTNIKTQAVDLVGKIKAPITDEFGLYAKLGANYLMTKSDNGSWGLGGADTSVKNLNVTYGAGAEYSITPNIIVNAEWLRFNGNPNTNDAFNGTTAGKYQTNPDAYMVGLRYKFDL